MRCTILNPPLNPFKRGFAAGHAYYHVLIDITKRYAEEFRGDKIYSPRHALNFTGRMAEEHFGHNYSTSLAAYKADFVRASESCPLNLSLEGLVCDDADETGRRVVASLDTLQARNLVVVDGSQIYLRVGMILRDPRFIEQAEDLQVFPSWPKNELLESIRRSDERHLVSSDALHTFSYAGARTSPLFNLAHVYELNADTDAAFLSANTVTKFGLLLMVKEYALTGRIGIGKLYVFNKVVFDDGWKDLGTRITDAFEGDVFRCVAAHSQSGTHNKVAVNPGLPRHYTKFLHQFANLRRIFSRGEASVEVSSLYHDYMTRFQYSAALQTVEQMVKQLRHDVDASKSRSGASESIESLRQRYLSIAAMLSPFAPHTVRIVNSEVLL